MPVSVAGCASSLNSYRKGSLNRGILRIEGNVVARLVCRYICLDGRLAVLIALRSNICQESEWEGCLWWSCRYWRYWRRYHAPLRRPPGLERIPLTLRSLPQWGARLCPRLATSPRRNLRAAGRCGHPHQHRRLHLRRHRRRYRSLRLPRRQLPAVPRFPPLGVGSISKAEPGGTDHPA